MWLTKSICCVYLEIPDELLQNVDLNAIYTLLSFVFIRNYLDIPDKRLNINITAHKLYFLLYTGQWQNLINMRTILLIGFLSIADAINPDWLNENHIWFYVIAFLGAILSDIYVTVRRNNER